jgi:hypothetical protein
MSVVLAAAGCSHSELPGVLGSAGPEMQMPREDDSRRGVAFDVRPDDAEVLVDGVVEGLASDFDGKAGVLHLSDGRHRVQIRKKGFQPYESIIYGSSEGSQRIQVELAPD